MNCARRSLCSALIAAMALIGSTFAAEDPSELVAIHVFIRTKGWEHYYAIDESEVNRLKSDTGYRYLGILGYGAKELGPGRIRMKRIERNGYHTFYTKAPFPIKGRWKSEEFPVSVWTKRYPGKIPIYGTSNPDWNDMILHRTRKRIDAALKYEWDLRKVKRLDHGVMFYLVPPEAVQRDEAVASKEITYQVGDLECRGYLAWDTSFSEPRPGVLVVHEWWGLNDYARQRANQLAARGYVAFACDLYGGGKEARHPEQAAAMAAAVRENLEEWRNRAAAGLQVLASQEQCDASELAAIGYCFGGATALQLAYSGADLKAVVTFHAALPVPSEEDKKRIKPRLVINQGADDPFVPKDAVDQFREALKDSQVDWTLTSYAGAKHGFSVKDAGERGLEGLEYNAEADQRSWENLGAVLQEALLR